MQYCLEFGSGYGSAVQIIIIHLDLGHGALQEFEMGQGKCQQHSTVHLGS